MPFYSPSTGGFYTKELHGRNVPADAFEISERKHASLMLAHSQGHQILMTRSGLVSRPITPSSDAIMARAIARTKREARRRILRIASLERQSNDNSALALGGKGFNEAKNRREAINAIRAASNEIEGYLSALAPDALAAFNPATSSMWP